LSDIGLLLTLHFDGNGNRKAWADDCYYAFEEKKNKTGKKIILPMYLAYQCSWFYFPSGIDGITCPTLSAFI
jgi:hypothetical protein